MTKRNSLLAAMTQPALIAILALAAPIGSGLAQTRPMGNWQSARHATYTNPFLAGSEFFLDVEITADGAFRGFWGQYICLTSTGAYGVNMISCSLQSGGGAASGKLAPGGTGEIELSRLGRSTFVWTSRTADEVSIELPKKWQGGEESILYKSRLWRKGKAPGSAGPSGPPPPPDTDSPLSANLVYREFVKDTDAALKKYAGKTIVLEGRRGKLINLSAGGVAIHVPDGYQPRAMVLMFPDARQAKGISEGAKFRFKCLLESFDYYYVHLQTCAVLPDTP